jgi:hypothetical protein
MHTQSVLVRSSTVKEILGGPTLAASLTFTGMVLFRIGAFCMSPAMRHALSATCSHKVPYKTRSFF